MSSHSTSAATILVVDDEPAIAALVADALTDAGYRALIAHDGEAALALAQSQPVDLAILDVMLPGKSGLEVCQVLRAESDLPILMLSARQSEADKVLGLGLGADDYVSKPFGIQELLARVAAQLRRQSQLQQAKNAPPTAHDGASAKGRWLTYGPLRLDLHGHRVWYLEQEVGLTAKEFEILSLLAVNPGQAFSRDRIYERLWGYDAEGDPTTVTVHIQKIRTKFKAQGLPDGWLKTIWGVGYRFDREELQ